MDRRAVFQSFAWFFDLRKRNLLDLDPPYQRRSVWNPSYQQYFIDTVLNNYPCPAIFLYEDISPDGVTNYKVIDGKQRLSTLFQFVENEIQVSDDATVSRLRGKYFRDFDENDKRNVWRYQLSVEYIPQENESLINNIFDRINRNVARLTPQELRHAKFSGEFISEVERKAEELQEILPKNFPNITAPARRQMKDVEFVAQLFLFLEGSQSYTSQSDLDMAFAERDEDWPQKVTSSREFSEAIEIIKAIITSHPDQEIVYSRLKNQADFYSLFGAIVEIVRERREVDPPAFASRLMDFVRVVSDKEQRANDATASTYYDDARSASNDAGPRRRRIDTIKKVLTGEYA